MKKLLLLLLCFSSSLFCMEERKLSSSELEKMPIWEMQDYLKSIEEQINKNQQEIEFIRSNKYDENTNTFTTTEDRERYDELLIKNQILINKVRELEASVEKKREQERTNVPKIDAHINSRLAELESRYQKITEEFDKIVNAPVLDKDRFNALVNEGDAIFKEKQILNKQLESLQQDIGGYPTIKIPDSELLYRASGAGFYAEQIKKYNKALEEKLRKLIAQYYALQDKRENMIADDANSDKIKEISQEIASVDKEMLDLVKDKKTPAYIYEIFKNERFPTKKKVSWAASVEEYEAGRPDRERKRAEIELARQHGITPHEVLAEESSLVTKVPLRDVGSLVEVKLPAQPIAPRAQQPSESELKLTPEIITRKPLLKQPEKPQRVLQPESAEKLKHELRILGQSLEQLMHALKVV